MTEETPTSRLARVRIEDLVPIVRKHRIFIGVFTAATLLLTLLVSLALDKQYKATAALQILPRVGQEMDVKKVVDYDQRNYLDQLQFYRTHVEVLRSRKLREDVWRRYQALGHGSEKTLEEGAGWLKNNLQVTPVESSQIINISVTHTDPEQAAILANLFADAYRQYNLESRRDDARDAQVWLEGKLLEYDAKVKKSHDELLEFKSINDLADADENVTDLAARLRTLKEREAELVTELTLLETSVTAHKAAAKAGKWEELARELATPGITPIFSAYLEARQAAAEVSARYGPSHPDRKRADSLVASLEDELRRAVEKELGAQQFELETLRAKQQSVHDVLQATHRQVLEKEALSSDYLSLKTEYQSTLEFYQALKTRGDEMDLASRTQFNNVRLLDPAVPPANPFKPDVLLNVGLALVLGTGLAVSLALLREALDDSIHSPADITMYLKVPCIGIVPKLSEDTPTAQSALSTHKDPRSTVAEAVRSVRTLLDATVGARHPLKLLVTSSVASEGKTGSSVRLAVDYARNGRRVLLVDCDLRRPTVHRVFGRPRHRGLSNVLQGTASATGVIVPTEVPNLFLVPAGDTTDRPYELLALPEMDDVIDAWSQAFDVIIIDTPPAGILSDAVLLARKDVDVVVVIREQTTSRVAVQETIDRLRKVEARIAGVILNAVDLQRHAGSNRYYYGFKGYYSRYGADQDEPPNEEAS